MLAALALAGVAVVGRSSSHRRAAPAVPRPRPTPTTRLAIPRNPVLPGDFPDPAVLQTETGYVAFATNTGAGHVPVAVSSDLERWRLTGDALPTLPRWSSDDGHHVWAPSVERIGSGFVLAVALRVAGSGHECIGIGRSASVSGPYVIDESGPTICQADLGGSIDPYLFEAGSRRWLLWKNDGNAIGVPSRLWSTELSASLRPVGPDHALLSLTGGWESASARGRRSDATIENPALIANAGTYYLLYSGNAWDTAGYAMGWATCASPAGPCSRGSAAPFLASAPGVVAGPGGGMAFTDRGGHWWLAYHGWTPGRIGYPEGARSLRVDRLQFSGNVPVVRATVKPAPR